MNPMELGWNQRTVKIHGFVFSCFLKNAYIQLKTEVNIYVYA